jgi:tellurite resistance protein TerB
MKDGDDMSFLASIRGAAKSAQNALEGEFSRLTNKGALDAMVGASVMIAAADGNISGDEKTKLLGYLKNSALTKAYSTDQVIKAFTDHAERFDFDKDVGESEALRIISKQRGDVDTARAIARLCIMIASADGNFDDSERRAATKIINELGLNPSEFL